MIDADLYCDGRAARRFVLVACAVELTLLFYEADGALVDWRFQMTGDEQLLGKGNVSVGAMTAEEWTSSVRCR